MIGNQHNTVPSSYVHEGRDKPHELRNYANYAGKQQSTTQTTKSKEKAKNNKAQPQGGTDTQNAQQKPEKEKQKLNTEICITVQVTIGDDGRSRRKEEKEP